MEQEKLESMLIDYIDGKLSEVDKQKVQQELTDNPKAQKLHAQLTEILDTMRKASQLEPSHSMQSQFDQAVREEIDRQLNAKGKQVSMRPVFFRVAAAIALVVSGVAVGFWINKNNQRDEELQALRIEMEATKRMMMSMLDNRESASQRVMGATVAFKMEKTDDQIVSALTHAMNEDPNTNVRLAALEALGKFNDDPNVKAALIKALATQKDPVVQIALIQLLVKIKEKNVVEELKRISDDEMAIPAVRDEAHAGILKLS